MSPWISEGEGCWRCPACGRVVFDMRPILREPWRCDVCGAVVDDGREWLRAMARGDHRLWARAVEEERAWLAQQMAHD